MGGVGEVGWVNLRGRTDSRQHATVAESLLIKVYTILTMTLILILTSHRDANPQARLGARR